MEGLALSPVNISYGLDLILQENWNSDREFQEAVALLLDKVQDAHLVITIITVIIPAKTNFLYSLIHLSVIVNLFSGNLFN